MTIQTARAVATNVVSRSDTWPTGRVNLRAVARLTGLSIKLRTKGARKRKSFHRWDLLSVN